MKRYEINNEIAEKLLVEPNSEYMVWKNGDEITKNELINEFHLTQYNDGQINVEHNTEDFRIEDVEFDDAIYDIEEY